MRYRSRGCRGRARAVGGAVPLARGGAVRRRAVRASRTAASPDPPRLTSQSGVFGAPAGAKDRPARPKRAGAWRLLAKAPAVRARRVPGEVHKKGSFDGETAGLPVGLAARGAELPRSVLHGRARPAAASRRPRNSRASRIFC